MGHEDFLERAIGWQSIGLENSEDMKQANYLKQFRSAANCRDSIV
jgi:hypothetical protein